MRDISKMTIVTIKNISDYREFNELLCHNREILKKRGY